MNSKQITLVTGTSLIIVAVILGALIILKLNTQEVGKDNVLSDNQDNTPVVEEIEENDMVEQVVEVPKMQDAETNLTADKEEVTSVEEPMPEKPEKPELEAPKDKPETNDDLEDMDNVPEYNEEDETTESVIEEEESESKLVPSSENPFTNPANAGNPTEIDGSDLSEYVPGTGDKF